VQSAERGEQLDAGRFVSALDRPTEAAAAAVASAERDPRSAGTALAAAAASAESQGRGSAFAQAQVRGVSKCPPPPSLPQRSLAHASCACMMHAARPTLNLRPFSLHDYAANFTSDAPSHYFTDAFHATAYAATAARRPSRSSTVGGAANLAHLRRPPR
jgi:hypothetical protein